MPVGWTKNTLMDTTIQKNSYKVAVLLLKLKLMIGRPA